MGMKDGMAREGIPVDIEEQISRVEQEATKLCGLFDEYGYSASEAPIYVALDEIRDDLEAESNEEDCDGG